MTDKERREDDILKNCIQEAYGLSDEQLLAELDEIEATLSEDEFKGVEDRLYQRVMEKEAVVSAQEQTSATAETRTANKSGKKGSKKKKWLVVGLAAVLAAGAGVCTIGESNYFLQSRTKPDGMVLNGGQNAVKKSDLNEAYRIAEEELDIPIIKMNHIPEGAVFEELYILEGNVVFVFSYNKEKVYLIQSKKGNEISMGINSDRNDSNEMKVNNRWLGKELVIHQNRINDDKVEYSAMLYQEESSYRVIGILSKEEMIEIVKGLSF